MSKENELLSVFEVELRRGVLSLAILSQLQSPQYGYSLLQSLTEKNVEIDAGTLYPMLRRLEKQGVLTSDWDTTESRPRKYYVLSETGKGLFTALIESWKNQSSKINRLLGGN